MGAEEPDTGDPADTEGGRHELPTGRPGAAPRSSSGRSGLLCLLLGVAIVTQVRQTESGDSLESARPADLLVLLDSLQQRRRR